MENSTINCIDNIVITNAYLEVLLEEVEYERKSLEISIPYFTRIENSLKERKEYIKNSNQFDYFDDTPERLVIRCLIDAAKDNFKEYKSDDIFEDYPRCIDNMICEMEEIIKRYENLDIIFVQIVVDKLIENYFEFLL